LIYKQGVPPVSRSTTPSHTVRLFAPLTAMSIALLSACGGGSDPDDTVNNDDPDPIIPVTTATTGELKSTAANTAGRSLGNALTGMQSVTGSADTSASAGLSQGNSSPQSFISSTLALDDSGNSVTTREGDRVTIDPDESQLCAEEFADSFSGTDSIAQCEALMADLSVVLNANGDEAGDITYLFQNNPVVTLGYGNGRDSMALNLGGLKLFVDASDALDPDAFGETGTPETMQGEISFIAINTNNSSGQEAGSVSIEVTQALAIGDSDAALSLGTGKLFSISADAGSGTGTMSFDIGAISAAAPFRDEDVASLNLDGFTGTAELDLIEAATGEDVNITVSNLGIGRGPLEMRINSVDALRLTMETFGFSVTETSDGLSEQSSVQINGDMNIGVMLDNASGLNVDASRALQAMLSVQAPGGTILGQSSNPSYGEAFKVLEGGPFSFSLSTTDESGSEDTSFSVNAGECYYGESASGSSSGTALLVDGQVVVVEESSTSESSEARVEVCD